MAKYALLLEYNGSDFHGWQIQANTRTIQGCLEYALSKFANEPVKTITAGRTDTGVHALNQVVHFTSNAKRNLCGWINGVNANLPASICVKQVAMVEDDFDARFSALSRTYHYYLLNQPLASSIFEKLVGWYHRELDLDAMQKAIKQLIGKQDFSSFRAANCQASSPVRDMIAAEIEKSGNILRFTFRANAFLYHMVRNIVGALVYVGNGRLSQDEFTDLIAAKNRAKAPPTFMPDGLYLAHVDYANNIFNENESGMWLFGGNSSD